MESPYGESLRIIGESICQYALHEQGFSTGSHIPYGVPSMKNPDGESLWRTPADFPY